MQSLKRTSLTLSPLRNSSGKCRLLVLSPFSCVFLFPYLCMYVHISFLIKWYGKPELFTTVAYGRNTRCINKLLSYRVANKLTGRISSPIHWGNEEMTYFVSRSYPLPHNLYIYLHFSIHCVYRQRLMYVHFYVCMYVCIRKICVCMYIYTTVL